MRYGRRRRAAEDFWALRHVSFDLEPGHTLGLIGPNGSGKTTLLKLIGGILTPTTGSVERRGRLAALLELGAGFHPDLTGRENVYLNASILGLTRRQTDEYLEAIVDFSGIERFIDNQVKFYSSGMYIRLAFSVAVHVEPEILLVDEVLAVGDEPFQRKCLARIKRFQIEGRTIIFVTHGLDMVRELCDRALVLDRGEVVMDSKPHEAIRTLRERQAPELVNSPDKPVVHQTGDVLIRESIVTDGHGQPRERFEPGDDVGVELLIDPQRPVLDPIVGINVYDHLGMLVGGTNTDICGVTLGNVTSPRRVNFRFPRIALPEGHYSVTAAVASADKTQYLHWLENRLSFRVISVDGQPGMLYFAPKIEVLTS